MQELLHVIVLDKVIALSAFNGNVNGHVTIFPSRCTYRMQSSSRHEANDKGTRATTDQ